ncbi:hypothetical protein SAMN06264855_10629 [Halorubrum vacuolatum]|uniref:Uncharacterized protein n=1 Tax=Halorubrum vacuolatum TaxID=63740 RepID=A0A238W964_HALVU|nr:hypothetical protein SAMN06264855_10629 [Halorubrum vacuolatum]
MLASNRVGTLGDGHRLASVRRRFFNELFHPFEDFLGAVLRFNNGFPTFFADLDFRPRGDTETFSHLLRENDSPL